MKKQIVTSVSALALAGAALGQSTVDWGIISFVAMTAQTNDAQYSSFIGGGATGGSAQGATAGAVFDYALLYTSYTGFQLAAPTSMAQLIAQNWQFTGLMATNSNTAGRLTPVAGSTHATVPWTVGVTNSIMLVGWSANLGSTWQVVSNALANWAILGASVPGDYAFFGTSATGYIAAGNADPGVSLFGSAAYSAGLPINSPNSQLYELITPEPGPLALAGLGALVLLALRRRK